MSDYYCVFRESPTSVWVSGIAHASEADAVAYGEAGAYMGDALVYVFACNTAPATPVGMLADQASHEWEWSSLFAASHPCNRLVARDFDQRRRDAEFSRKVRSTQA